MDTQIKEVEPSLLNAAHPNKNSVVELVRRWGGSASDAVLDPANHIFSIPAVDGLIGYRKDPGCAVVFGDPVCSPDNLTPLVSAFHQFCKSKGWGIIYLTASEQFAHWSASQMGGAIIEFGTELFINPQCDPRKLTGVNASLVRRKVKHALREHVSINEYTGQDIKLEKAIEQVGIDWLSTRRGPQIYTSRIRLFDDRIGKRWFYAQKGDQIVGIVVLNQIQAYEGWLINRLMVTPQAPNGTPELLIVSALEKIASEGCCFATFGSVTAEQLGKIEGIGAFSSWIARHSFKIAKKIFHLEGHNKFWEKFHPQSRPSYLLFDQSKVGLKEIVSLKRALNVSL